MPHSNGPTPRTSTVELSRRVVVALVATLVAALVTLAFFVGRETARSGAAAPVETPAAGLPPPDSAPAESSPARPARAEEHAPSSIAEPAATTSARPVPPAAGTAELPASTSARVHLDRDAVARYFEAFHAIQTAGSAAGDREAFATALLSQGAQGDWSELDRIGHDQRSMLDRLQRLSVPASCREYHARALDLMRTSIALLDGVKAAVRSGNAGGLAQLSAQAQRLQAEATEVQALADAVRRQVGLPATRP